MERNHALDGVRGIAAAAVVLFHSMLALNGTVVTDILNVPIYELSSFRDIASKVMLTVFHGDTAVVLFFLLSGCVLIGTLERDLPRHGLARTALAFSVRRLLRIYPAMALSLVIGLLVFAVPYVVLNSGWYPFTPANVGRNLLLIAPEVNGPTWTLILELLVSPLLVLCAVLLVRMGALGLLVFLAYAYAAQRYTWLVLDNALLAHYLIDFALGCMVPYGPGRIAGALGRRIGWLPLLVVLLGIHAFAIDVNLQAVLGFVLIALVYHRPPERLERLLMLSGVQYLGRISYGVYLFHYMFIGSLWTVTVVNAPSLSENHPVLTGAMAALPILVVTIGLADMSERTVERMGVAAGRRISQRILTYRNESAATSATLKPVLAGQ